MQAKRIPQTELDDSASSDGPNEVAIHVAGHAVIALAQNVEVFYLTIGNTHSTVPSSRAANWIDSRVLVEWPDHWPASPFLRSRLTEKYVRIALAGSVAQQLYEDSNSCATDGSVCEHDYSVAWSAAALLWDDEQERSNYLQATLQKLKVTMQFSHFHDEMLSLVAALEERGGLFQSDIREVLAAG